MSVGIRRFFRKTANQSVNASTVLVDLTDLSVPIAANQKARISFWVPFTVGATGGFKFQLTTPAAVVSFLASLQVVDGTAAAPGNEVATVQLASAAFANAWANVGSHYLLVECDIANGVNAGNITLQMACNSAANGITAIAGASADVVIL